MIFLIIAAPLAAAIVVYCVWAMRREHRIETTAHLNAPAHEVWAVLTDFASYGEWNPFISAISGRPAEDERLDVVLARPNGGRQRLRPTVLRVSPARRLHWFGRLGPGGLLDGEHYFVLEPQKDGTTRLTHGKRFTGVLVPVMTGPLDQTTTGVEAMNTALAERIGTAER